MYTDTCNARVYWRKVLSVSHTRTQTHTHTPARAGSIGGKRCLSRNVMKPPAHSQHTSAYSIRQHTSAYVTAYVSIRQRCLSRKVMTPPAHSPVITYSQTRDIHT